VASRSLFDPVEKYRDYLKVMSPAKAEAEKHFPEYMLLSWYNSIVILDLVSIQQRVLFG
jgi:hypothetical protein